MFLVCLETKFRNLLKLLLAMKQKNKCAFYNSFLIALDQFTKHHDLQTTTVIPSDSTLALCILLLKKRKKKKKSIFLITTLRPSMLVDSNILFLNYPSYLGKPCEAWAASINK